MPSALVVEYIADNMLGGSNVPTIIEVKLEDSDSAYVICVRIIYVYLLRILVGQYFVIVYTIY